MRRTYNSTVSGPYSPKWCGTAVSAPDGSTKGRGGSPKNTSCGEYPVLLETVALIEAVTHGNNSCHVTPSLSYNERLNLDFTKRTMRSALPFVHGAAGRVIILYIPSASNNAVNSP
jgi:hypothetical protein